MAESIFKRMQFLLLSVVVFILSIPLQSAGQVTIKETMELADTTNTRAQYANQETQQLQGYYLSNGGSYSVTVDFFLGYRLFDLWEQGLGHIADYSYSEQEIHLGAFDQWTNLNFYLYNPGNDYKLPPDSRDDLGGAFIRLTNEQIDSSRATIPPAPVLDYYGNPFKPAGHISLDERWGYIKIQRVRGTGAKNLYIENPYKQRLVSDVQDSVGKNIRVGPVTPGDSLLFYITSSHDIVSGKPLYGENDNDTWVYFEDWTDLNFLDVKTQLYNGLMPSDPNEIDINVLPYAAIYGDTSYVYFTGRTNVGRDKNFPNNQRFDVWIEEGAQQYGTLVSADGAQRGTSLSGVCEPVLFVSNTVDELGFEPGFSSLDIHAQTTLQAPYPPYQIEGEGNVRLRREVLKVGFDPLTIAPGDTTTVVPYFQYRDGERQYFPDDHEFFVIIVRKGYEFGHLVSEDGEDLGLGENYISPGFKYVAHQDIEQDSAVVWFYLATDITYDRSFEQSKTAQKATRAESSALSSGSSGPAQNNLEEEHRRQAISALKAGGQDALVEQLSKQRVQASATAAATSSEEGETSFEVGYGRLAIKGQDKTLEITEELEDELWPYLPDQNNNGDSRGDNRPGYNPADTTLTILVKQGEQSLENASVVIRAEYQAGTGGHLHTNPLPIDDQGTFWGQQESGNPITLTTDSVGIVRIDSFRTSQISGEYIIRTFLEADSTIQDSLELEVRVPDLENFADVESNGKWSLTGDREGVHESGHWATSVTIDSLSAALEDFYNWSKSEQGGGRAIPLEVNDISLIWGGSYEYNGDWNLNSRHSFHRVGLSVDMERFNTVNGEVIELTDVQIEQLTYYMKRYGGIKYDEEPIHYGFDGGN